jgi:hypothetical protein
MSSESSPSHLITIALIVVLACLEAFLLMSSQAAP